jgi:hypothetical protein
VCKTIQKQMKQSCLPLLARKAWVEIAWQFEQRASFPNCIDCVAGKHVWIVKPANSGLLYWIMNNCSRLYYWLCVMQARASRSLILEHTEKILTRQVSKTMYSEIRYQ